MTTETLSKEAALAVQHYEAKLAFETGPIGVQYAQKNGDPIQVVDLRTKELYDKGHVPGAINLSYEELEKSTAQLNKDKTIVPYCYNITCNLSTKAALLLAKKGFKTKELLGGWKEWAKNDLPVEGKELAGGSCGTSKHSCG